MNEMRRGNTIAAEAIQPPGSDPPSRAARSAEGIDPTSAHATPNPHASAKREPRGGGMESELAPSPDGETERRAGGVSGGSLGSSVIPDGE